MRQGGTAVHPPIVTLSMHLSIGDWLFIGDHGWDHVPMMKSRERLHWARAAAQVLANKSPLTL